ncbi:MAG: OmpA family protein [Saprospiraceae bacterium]|nr:OmpA family protein [Saprospiraceae bacterium]
MSRKLFLFCSFFLFLFHTTAMGQRVPTPTADDFIASGGANFNGSGCYSLTSATQWMSGSIWYKTAIDLRQPFDMELKLFLGCEDQWGADGMVLVFHPYLGRQGYRGEGIGFAGLYPSLGLEVDTYRNGHLEDPYDDHVALMANGRPHHAWSLAGPNRITNIEDCKDHMVRVQWQPSAQRMSLLIDGKQVLSYKGDIINEIFGGNSKVYWGVTAATGRYVNRHEICFEKLVFTKVAPLGRLNKSAVQSLSKGKELILPRLQFSSGQTKPEGEALEEINKILRYLREHPKAIMEINAFTDGSGNANRNQELSQLRAKAIADYLRSRGIPKRQIKARGFGEKFPIAPNNTSDGRRKNRRVVFRLVKPIV